jgi:hypothetical protein
MIHEQTTENVSVMAAKATPPLAVVGANLMGIPISDWVQYVTLIYVSLMAAHFVWKWRREIKKANKEDAE